MQSWNLSSRPKSPTDLPVEFYTQDYWHYWEHYSYAYERLMDELQHAKPSSICFIVPDVQSTFYPADPEGDEYVRWIYAISSLNPARMVISVLIGNDGETCRIELLSVQEHLLREPEEARIAALARLHHHHTTHEI